MSCDTVMPKVSARSRKERKQGSRRPFSMLLMNGRPRPECTARSVWVQPRRMRIPRRRSPKLRAMSAFRALAFLETAGLGTVKASIVGQISCVAHAIHRLVLVSVKLVLVSEQERKCASHRPGFEEQFPGHGNGFTTPAAHVKPAKAQPIGWRHANAYKALYLLSLSRSAPDFVS